MASFLTGYMVGVASVLLPAAGFIAFEMWRARVDQRRARETAVRRYLRGLFGR